MSALLPLLLVALTAPSAPRMSHPQVRLVDAAGRPVIQSGAPIDTLESCGGCHDTAYIEAHNFHSQAGAHEAPAQGARPWDLSPGLFGRWDPLTYARLSAEGDAYPDLDAAAWTRSQARHVGGGPAVGAQLNCFLCHTPTPNNAARLEALQAGAAPWAATATLAGVIAAPTGDPLRPFRYDPAAFEADGRLKRGVLRVRAPRDESCGLCHGVVAGIKAKIDWEPSLGAWETETTGQIFSPQRIARSVMNIADRETLGRPWDVHSERMLRCSKCHHSPNNPAAFIEHRATRPAHLKHDARTLDVGQYLHRPSHHLTKGDSAQGTVEASMDESMRRCEGCHDPTATHAWLPYRARHMQAMLCETCHIPKIYAPARQQTDWTLIDADAAPGVVYRGIEGPPGDSRSLITGFEPTILAREAGVPDKLAPHNLITSWFWVQDKGGVEAPVRLADLEAAFLPDGRHHPKLVAALDADRDGALDAEELRLDTEEGVAVARALLIGVGVSNPKIVGEIQPYSLHHGVATGAFVLKRCEACHGEDSHLTRPFELSSYVPFGAEAKLVGDTNVTLHGEMSVDAGRLIFTPSARQSGHYILGHDNTPYADLFGLLSLLGVLLGVTVHGGLRYLTARRQRSK